MTKPINDMTPDEIVAAGLSRAEQLRAQISAIEKARAEQPERLAKARAEADEAREQSMLMEPWTEQLSALRAHTADGQPLAAALTLPNIIAKEMFGARLAFDALDCADDNTGERIGDVITRMFTMVDGDTGQAMLLLASALETIVTIVVPQLLDEIEHQAGNWDARVMFAQARTKAWRGRIAELNGNHDNQ